MKHLEEVAELRGKVRAMRLAFINLPGILVALYASDGRCVLLEGMPYATVTACEGKHFRDFVPFDRVERFIWLFERARHGEIVREDYPIGDVITEAIVRRLDDQRGEFQFILFYCRDVTAERAAAEAMRAAGAVDSLTGVPTRSVLQAHIAALIRKAEPFHVLFFDVDRFKRVNDTMGHAAGDVLLQRIARRVQASIRQGEIVVRRGGDEFVAVLGHSSSPTAAARRILRDLLEVVEPYGAGISIGIASYPEDGTTHDDLVAAADAAMYKAKVLGGDALEKA